MLIPSLHMKRFALLFVFILTGLFLPNIAAGQDSQYPAWYESTSRLNIREWDNTYSRVITTVKPHTRLKVIGRSSNGWAVLEYDGQKAHCSFQYVRYIGPYNSGTASQGIGNSYAFKNSISNFWSKAQTWLYILLAIVVLIFWKEILQILIFIGVFVGLGALAGLLFGNPEAGAVIGAVFVLLIGLHRLYDMLGNDFSEVSGVAYIVISFPFYFLNRLQYFCYGPWRVFFKTSWVNDTYKPYVKWTLEIIKYILYIVSTPLRFINAVAYNLLIRGFTELYDLTYEVFAPSDPKEGAGEFWTWLMMLPWRILKYPLFHGTEVFIEGVIWTGIDIFVPAITLYHGTDLTAGDAITRSAKRNSYLRKTSQWTCGTFTASQSSWGGIGVYFAAKRSVAQRYATDPYRLNDRNPIMIVCRVSLGATINYAFAPYYVYRNAGQNGNPSILNKYANDNGYVTGEWWNDYGGYWEYCMFDWKNKYNHPWRIRPIYVYNFRTQRTQHISGGIRHWFFDKDIFDDLTDEFFEWWG